LGVTASRAGLWAWGQRQHGAIDATRSIAVTVAFQQLQRAPFAARVGKFVDSDRDGPAGARTTAASFHCGRSRGADSRANDYGPACWARTPAERLSTPSGAPQNPAPRRPPRGDIPAAVPLTDCRSSGLDKSRLGSAAGHAGWTRQADAGARKRKQRPPALAARNEPSLTSFRHHMS